MLPSAFVATISSLRGGEIVEIVTVDRGRGRTSTEDRRAPREERWRAIVLIPNAFAPGWWIVKKIAGNQPLGQMTYTVPEAEIVRVIRKT